MSHVEAVTFDGRNGPVEFKVRWVLGHPPECLPAGKIAMVAPRPLSGVAVLLNDDWGWAGQVFVDPSDLDAIELNSRADAQVVVWITDQGAVAAERARLLVEYPEMRDEIGGLSDRDLIVSWQTQRS